MEEFFFVIWRLFTKIPDFKNKHYFIMKKNLLIFFILVLGANLFAQNIPVNKANYQLADRFSPDRLKKMVFSTRVDPHWLKNSERFWHAFETPEGKTYWLVDPAKEQKRFCLTTLKWLQI